MQAAADPGEVLLTGSTGFLGAFLLRDLMRTTRATVHCLVRADTPESGLARLRESLEWYRVWDEVDPERLRVVAGDLSAPALGLAPEEFDSLARSVDAVYHAGATVNWLRPYPALRDANVTGTEEVLRLAARHRSVPVHHMSTTGVFAGPAPDGGALTEDGPTGPARDLPSGYLQSKWVAEQVVELARGRGLPVSVYRIDVICGDRQSGACQTQDFVWLALKGLVQSGAVPESLGGTVHPVPVDHVSASVCALSLREENAGRTFHFHNTDHFDFGELADHLRELGHRLDTLSWDRWSAKVRADRDNAVLPLFDAFELMVADSDSFYPRINTGATERALAGLGLRTPPLTKELFTTYVRFFREVGYLPAPNAPHSAAHGTRPTTSD